jgi:eukaryotic-like serine/threonine-protein kinase
MRASRRLRAVVDSANGFWDGEMSSRVQFSRKVCFGEFELNLETAELWSNGSKAILPGQPLQVLVTLLDRPGQLVTREELRKRLWPSHTFVDFDQSLNKAVNRLREALEDSAEHPRFIETLPRRGYRFIASVQTGVAEIPVEGVLNQSTEQVPPMPSDSNHWFSTKGLSSEIDENPDANRYSRQLIPAAILTALTMGLVVFAIYKWRSHPNVPELASTQLIKMTDSGRARDVAISPDGRYVVYSLRDGEEESLRLRQIATQSDIQILAQGPGFHGLTFSLDGNYVYFIRSDSNDPFFKYLYSMPMLGGPVRKLVSDVDSPVSFSPDGHQFAFERGVAKRNVVELRIANVEGSGERLLTTIQDGDVSLFQPGPSWSHDGRTIVAPFRILGTDRRWILVSISVPDGKMREIYSSQGALGRPIWLTEHSLLISHYDTTYERAQLWTISYPEGVARRFTNDLSDYDQPLDISRDGSTVTAIASAVISNIWVGSEADSLNPRQISSGEVPMIDITETANGKLLSTSGDGRLWFIDPNSGQKEPFVDTRGVGSLTMCGSFVLFTVFGSDAVTITRANADGSHSIKLVTGDVRHAACSPDGKFVFYVNGHRPQKIWRISVDGGSPVEIAAGVGEGITGPLDISPDGMLLSYPFDEYPPVWKIAVCSVNGGPPAKMFKVPGGTSRVRWSPTGTDLQYLVTDNGTTNIWEQPLSGRKPKQLTKFTSGRIFDFNWSSDRKRLLLTRGDETSNVVMLSNLH